MNSISILVKPSSSLCNMKCSYCFYEDVSNNRLVKNHGMMSIQTMQKIIDRGLEFLENGNIHFAFQGGEPTLIGLDFYYQFVDYVRKNKKSQQHITYSIQTNGTTMNEKWVHFFKEHHFLVGVSIDGIEWHHNKYRPYLSGRNTFADIMKNTQLLLDHGVDTNVLCVVNNEMADQIDDVYTFFQEKKLKYMQFIPQIHEINNQFSEVGLDNDHYLIFLKKLFDRWYKDLNANILSSVRYFDNMLLIYLGYEPESCDLKGKCSIQNVIESDGSIYPCDFYATDINKLGTVHENSIAEVLLSKKAKEFIDESLIKSEECYSCQWFQLCRTGCKRKRDEFHKDIYCETYKAFFSYANERFIHLAYQIKNGLIIQ